MNERKDKETPPPSAVVMQMMFSFAPGIVLLTAAELGIFAHVGAGKSAEAIARAAGTSMRGTPQLLDALVAFGFLAKDGGIYRVTPLGQVMVPGTPDYMGAFVRHSGRQIATNWLQLPDVVRNGKPLMKVEAEALASDFFPALVDGLHVTSRAGARLAATLLRDRGVGGAPEILDVACGSGVWGIGFAEIFPEARVTAHDFAAILELTKGYAGRHGVGARFRYLAGDLKTVDFGEGAFDMAILGNIVHSEGEASSRDLFGRMHRALKPGGRLIIVDMIPNDERTGPPFPLIFALNMLVHTELGDSYTLADYRNWLGAAGFGAVETLDIHSHSPLIVARKT